MALKVKLWGVRGSLPSPLTPNQVESRVEDILKEFVSKGLSSAEDIKPFLASLPHSRLGGYGGNTTCVEVNSNQSQLVIDAGSGIRGLGQELMSGPCGKGQGEFHLYFTHFHWDHIIGLTLFPPIYIPGNKVHVYAVHDDVEHALNILFDHPCFPVKYNQLGAEIIFHKLEPRKPFVLSDLSLTPYQLDHPNPCWGVKVESGGKVYSHCVDTEAIRVSQDELGEDLPLYQGVDMMFFDAQYTIMETVDKMDWGHSSAATGLDIAMREGIKKIVFGHHDPASPDIKIEQVELEASRYYKTQIKSAKRSGVKVHEVEWTFAIEGQVIEI